MKAPPVQKPSIGRIVHFVIDGEPFKNTVNGEIRAAMIVKIFKDPYNENENEKVQLQVFIDGLNDAERDGFGHIGPSTIWIPGAPHDENKSPGTWHWPARV